MTCLFLDGPRHLKLSRVKAPRFFGGFGRAHVCLALVADIITGCEEYAELW
jgi:hypothetical protein